MDDATDPRQAALKLMIVQGAMTTAPYLVLPVALAVGPVFQGSAGAEVIEILFWIAFGMPFGALPVGFLVYRASTARILAAKDARNRRSAINGRAIVLTALFEATALFAVVNILLSGFDWRTIPGLAGPVLVLAVLFPKAQWFGGETTSRLDQYS